MAPTSTASAHCGQASRRPMHVRASICVNRPWRSYMIAVVLPAGTCGTLPRGLSQRCPRFPASSELKLLGGTSNEFFCMLQNCAQASSSAAGRTGDARPARFGSTQVGKLPLKLAMLAAACLVRFAEGLRPQQEAALPAGWRPSGRPLARFSLLRLLRCLHKSRELKAFKA